MLRVALTGGIATGKSYVLDQFRDRGVPCLDADDLAHGVMASGTEATSAIAARFGDVLGPDGSVDRQKLGRLVFADAAARRELETIVHPAVYRSIAAGLRGFELLGDAPLAMVAIPLLHETGHATAFAKVIATLCPVEMQRTRLRDRGLSDEAIALRLAAQLPADGKAARADYVIRTDGTFAETKTQVDRVLRELMTLASR